MTYPGHMRNGVAVLDTPVDLPDGTPVQIAVVHEASDFWRSKSLSELASEQGVRPVLPKELAGHWPEEDSIDEFLALVRKVRL